MVERQWERGSVCPCLPSLKVARIELLSQGLSLDRIPLFSLRSRSLRPLGLARRPRHGGGGGACVVDFRDSRQEVSLVGGGGREGKGRGKMVYSTPRCFNVFINQCLLNCVLCGMSRHLITQTVLHWQKKLALGLLCNRKGFVAC